MTKRALILLSGARWIPERREGDIVICADSGYIKAVEASLEVDHLVGDMDSLPPSYLEDARRSGVDILVHDRDKDLSDGEIALRLAMALECESLFITGGKTGRWDHVISTLYLPFLSDGWKELEIWLDMDRILLLRSGDSKEFNRKWKVVSLIPVENGCIVTVEGLKWPLRSEKIELGSTRGIHNEPIGDRFKINCEKGSLFVILSDQA